MDDGKVGPCTRGGTEGLVGRRGAGRGRVRARAFRSGAPESGV